MQLLKILNWFYSDSDSEVDGWDHYGYRTSEYTSLDEVQPYIWESTRGLGGSFAYNHLETEEDMLNGDELISFLIDTVSKNGNILIIERPRIIRFFDPEKRTVVLKIRHYILSMCFSKTVIMSSILD